MKKVLLISPHFPPSNLAAVHRSRFFAMHLPSFGWEPYVLMVDEKFYEEKLDPDLVRLLPDDLKIFRARAFQPSRPRLIGDIGLRGFFQLYRSARKIIVEQKIDYLLIPIPSFYVALLGRWLHRSTGVKYGIDYIDPWVHQFPGSDKIFSRHWFSTKLAKMLEPVAVKNATLISGVSEGYYKGVLDRNPHLRSRSVAGAMPYGGEWHDHQVVAAMDRKAYLFESTNKLRFVYAGAMLPKAYAPLRSVFKVLQESPELTAKFEFHFIGTGKHPNDSRSYNIKPIAEEFGLWETTVWEYPARIPYLDVLVHLNASDAIFILGSTEPHYTPSKVFQAVLSRKPLLAVLHKDSSALQVVRQTHSGIVCAIDPEHLDHLENNFTEALSAFSGFYANYNPDAVDLSAFEAYSAKAVTKKMADLLDKACAL